ncbi:MAG: hypothetical protein R2909_00225 [Gemmatimonadales bacterium]
MNSRAGLVIVRNALLPIGAYLLGWSKPEAAFWIWFDGVSSLLAAAIAIMTIRAAKDGEEPSAPSNLSHYVMVAIAAILVLGLIGLPYWFGLAFLLLKVFDLSFLIALVSGPVVLFILAGTLLSNIVEEALRGAGLSVEERRRQFEWDFEMHAARAAAIIVCVALPIEVIAVAVAAVLSYSEIRPLRRKSRLRAGSP